MLKNIIRRIKSRHNLSKACFVVTLIILVAAYEVFLGTESGYAQEKIQSTVIKNESFESRSVSQPSFEIPVVDPEKLLSHVEALSFERYTEADRRKARDYIFKELISCGLVPELDEYETGINLVAERPGTDDEAGVILLGAHYDTVRNSPGADDNASGIAAVLEIARLLSRYSTARTLRVVFFDQEERIIAGNALIGSVAYVSDDEHLAALKGAVILEMVGYACYTAGCQKQPEWSSIDLPSEVGDFLAVVGDREHPLLTQAFQQPDTTNLPAVVTLSVPFKGLLTPDFMRSDHSPFWLKNIGAVMVTDTSYFRNPNYHLSSDTIATIDKDFLSGTTQLVINALISLLN